MIFSVAVTYALVGSPQRVKILVRERPGCSQKLWLIEEATREFEWVVAHGPPAPRRSSWPAPGDGRIPWTYYRAETNQEGAYQITDVYRTATPSC